MASKRRRLLVGLIATVLVATSAALFLRRPRGPLDVHVLSDRAPGPNEDGLIVDVQVLRGTDAETCLKGEASFRRRPYAYSHRLLSNPLCGAFLRVSIRNASAQALTLKATDDSREPRFAVGVVLEDGGGGVVLPAFASAALNSLKSLGPRPEPEPVVLAPGASVVREIPLWDSRGWVGLHLDAGESPPSGLYTARVVCDYTRAGVQDGRRVEGPPILVRVAPVDVWEWRSVQEMLHGDPSIILELIGYLFR